MGGVVAPDRPLVMIVTFVPLFAGGESTARQMVTFAYIICGVRRPAPMLEHSSRKQSAPLPEFA